MNTKTTQTKNSAPKKATKPSAKTKAGKTTKTASKAPQSAPVPPEAALDAMQSETPIEQDAPATLAADVVDGGVDPTDQNALVPDDEMGDHNAVASDTTDASVDDTVLPDVQVTQSVEPTPESATDSAGVDTSASAPTEDRVESANEPTEDTTDSHAPDDQAEPDEGEKSAEKIASSEDALNEKASSPAKKLKSAERQLRSTNPRYAAAAGDVARLRKEFISALNTKSAILKVPRIGEAVPVRSDEMDALNTEIREARQKLDDLLERKRQLKGNSPELEAINQRIRELSRQRNAARVVKQTVYDEEMANRSALSVEASAAA